MFNPHPPLSAFPFALLLISWAAEIIAYFRYTEASRGFARIVFRLVCCITPLTYLSGYWGAELADQTFTVNPELIARHQAWGKTLLIALIPTLLFSVLLSSNDAQPKWLRPFYLVLLTLCLVLAMSASFYGGELVFRYGAGVFAPIP